MPERPAVLLDIDGTLVDSTYLHVQAWSEAMEEIGHDVDTWRIHRAIGMDSAKLLDALLGDAVESDGDAAKEAHSRRYARLAPRLRPFRDARALLTDLAGADLQVVLATSAPEEELQHLLEVLDADRWITHITSADDVDTAKPAPDVVEVALDRAGVDPDRAVMVGDATWDSRAAAKVGVTAVGVLSGGISESELLEAGASVVLRDPTDLLAQWRSGPIGDLLRS
ncbi:HAD-IA family hydrolase [Nakamurella sp. YIM 132087]|uniref:HAD-IA family hydrolase n=1 Tax=Nakamurella alba TaxID=2665158 RepID=A0A7K1FM39_9ACTN|nr:HAD family hydrolase [Nakamurella alba]MTD15217.1 HAD-IA family hydrolase [Nakamurella alba]